MYLEEELERIRKKDPHLEHLIKRILGFEKYNIEKSRPRYKDEIEKYLRYYLDKTQKMD